MPSGLVPGCWRQAGLSGSMKCTPGPLSLEANLKFPEMEKVALSLLIMGLYGIYPGDILVRSCYVLEMVVLLWQKIPISRTRLFASATKTENAYSIVHPQLASCNTRNVDF